MSSLTTPDHSSRAKSHSFVSVCDPLVSLQGGSMKRQLCSLVLVALALCSLATPCLGKNSSEVLKQHERNTISLELEFAKKNPSALQRVISFLNWGPNGYATGFLVGGRLVMTAYHVVSGELDESKKLALGFGRHDKLEVKVYT